MLCCDHTIYDYIWKRIMFNIAYGKMHEYLAWKRISIFEIPLIMEFMDLWYYLEILKMLYLNFYYLGNLCKIFITRNGFKGFKNIVDIWIIEIFYETTWKWTMYFKYINVWAFDVVLPLCHDIGDYPLFVRTTFVWWPVFVRTTFVWWPVYVTTCLCDVSVYVTTPSMWWPCHVALGEVLGFAMVFDIFRAHID